MIVNISPCSPFPVTNAPSVDVTLMEFGDDVECDEPLAASSGSSDLQQLRQAALVTTSHLKLLAELARAGREKRDLSQSMSDAAQTITDPSLGGADSALGGTDSALGGTDSNMSVVPMSEPSLDLTLMEPTVADAAKFQVGAHFSAVMKHASVIKQGSMFLEFLKKIAENKRKTSTI